jgi:hypothetical protein
VNLFHKISLFSIAAAGLALTASADTITYSLSESACTGGCAVPAGTVQIAQVGSNPGEVAVTVSLSSDYFNHTTKSDQHWAFAFELPSSNFPTIYYSGLNTKLFTFQGETGSGSSGTASSDSYTESGLGNFDYSVQCTGCVNSTPTTAEQTLTFDLTGTNLTPASFTQSTGKNGGYYFGVDIVEPDGTTTGNVGAPGPGTKSVVPEPSTLALLGTGFLGLAGLVRRRLIG